MNVVIAGFTDYNKLNNTLMKLIEEKQFFLFTILCGGTSIEYDETGSRIKSIGEIWAEKNGLPMLFLHCADAERLLEKTAQTADYIVADLSTDNQWVKRLVMKMKSLGKHGTVTRGED